MFYIQINYLSLKSLIAATFQRVAFIQKEDVEKIVDSSIDGLLVGEALMKTNDLSQFCLV